MWPYKEAREVSFFTWRGDQVLSLDQKGGSKDFFFKLKRWDHLYFWKKQNILLNILGSRERDCQMQLGDENSNGTFQVNVKTLSYILVLM